MNRIFLAIACLGAFAAIIASDAASAPGRQAPSEDRGSMTTQSAVNSQTGETEDTRVIAFMD